MPITHTHSHQDGDIDSTSALASHMIGFHAWSELGTRHTSVETMRGTHMADHEHHPEEDNATQAYYLLEEAKEKVVQALDLLRRDNRLPTLEGVVSSAGVLIELSLKGFKDA